eukprot:COSAG04_NODE_19525_length_414_cov_0.711111_1_plen_91_part_10
MLTRQWGCFVAGVHQLRNLFQSLDKDGSGSVSRFEFREFLKPYNLNLSPDALTALVDLFDDDHDGAPPPPPPPPHPPPPPNRRARSPPPTH